MRALAYILTAFLLTPLAACGPRADNTPLGGGAYGAKPQMYYDGHSQVKTPPCEYDGNDILLRVPYDVHASDSDGSMWGVVITLSYVSPDGSAHGPFELTSEFRPEDQVRSEIWVVGGETDDQLRVPGDKYPGDGHFGAAMWVEDLSGNRSSSVGDTLVTTCTIGSG